MAYIEGDADHGFTITIDGPTSLFVLVRGMDLRSLNCSSFTTCYPESERHVANRDFTQTLKNWTLQLILTVVWSHYPPGKPTTVYARRRLLTAGNLENGLGIRARS